MVVFGGGFGELDDGGRLFEHLAAAVEDVDRDVLAGQIKDLEEDVADKPQGQERDRAAQRLDQLKSLLEVLGR